MSYPRNAKGPASLDSIDEVTARRLLAFIERIERLEAERKALGEDTKDVYGEARSDGFDTKVMKTIIGIRRKDPAQRTEEETILDVYLTAIAKVQQ